MTTDLPARFWAKVDTSGDCWLWTGGVTGGYGKCYIDGRQSYVHRVVYAALVGSIPEGALIDHLCHNKPCCNPEHLRLADVVLNGRNRAGAQVNSRSGVRGVHPFGERWRVQVKADGRVHSGGVFDTLEEADRAAVALRALLLGEV